MSHAKLTLPRELAVVASLLAIFGGAVVTAWFVPEQQPLVGQVVLALALVTAVPLLLPGLRERFYSSTTFGVWLLGLASYHVLIEGAYSDLAVVMVAGGVLSVATGVYRRLAGDDGNG